MGTKETDHRFVGLGVDEVSLVDHPANEEEWLTIKRLEAKEMTTENETKTVEATEPVTEATPVEKAETTETTTETTTEKTTEETIEEDAEKALNPMQALALLKKIEALLKGAAGGGEKAPPFGKKAATKKSLMGLTADGELVINAELLADVSKARSFTGKRIGAITDAAKAMITLLNEVAPDQVKKLIEFAPKPDIVPAKKSVDPEPEPEPAKPDLSETLVDAVTKAIAPVDERLKALEGSRGEPKSTDGDQTADITKSKDENIWAGRFN